MIRTISKNAEAMYKRFYPNLSLDEIRLEIEKFELTMIVNGPISETSANETKYLRGWLSKANEIKSHKEIK